MMTKFKWYIWAVNNNIWPQNKLLMSTFTVKRDIQDNDEEAVRVKEQSILELGGLLAKTGQAAGKDL